MRYYEKDTYRAEIGHILEDWESAYILRNRVVAITGARGLIGSEWIDTVMAANQYLGLNCKIYGIVRNMEAALKRFKRYENTELFQLIQADINKDVIIIDEDIDYFIHGASNTHPLYYAARPIETILTNTVGTNQALAFAAEHNCKRFIFLSSVEIYGENRGDIDKFDESYVGYIDSNTLRAGYPEGKRTGEALCQAYRKEKNLDCIILRIARAYGPGILKEDSKALSQFLNRGLKREDIVLKSKGDQLYSYIYAADVVSAILFLAAKGEDGEAYNLSGPDTEITLAGLAAHIARIAGTKVVYDIPDGEESAGYSKATKALLDTDKLSELGWHPRYSLAEGIRQIFMMQEED